MLTRFPTLATMADSHRAKVELFGHSRELDPRGLRLVWWSCQLLQRSRGRDVFKRPILPFDDGITDFRTAAWIKAWIDWFLSWLDLLGRGWLEINISRGATP